MWDGTQGQGKFWAGTGDDGVSWNDLTWLAACTLKAGAVVAIGPGQSVSAETCNDKTGAENYPANQAVWQTYIDKPWTRSQELHCPDVSADYETDPADISRRKQMK